MKTSVIILAGGQATRMGNLSLTYPKSLLGFNGVPFLGYLVSWFIRQGCEDIILSTSHLSRDIEVIFGKTFWRDRGVRIIKDPHTALGTGGAIANTASRAICSEIIICNGDTVVEFDLAPCLNRHLDMPFPVASVVTRNVGVPNQGCLLIEGALIVEFSEGQGDKNLRTEDGKYRASSTGTYMARRSFLIDNCPKGAFSWEKEFLPMLVTRKLVGAIDNGNRFFHDYGTPDRYAQLTSQSEILERIYGQPL